MSRPLAFAFLLCAALACTKEGPTVAEETAPTINVRRLGGQDDLYVVTDSLYGLRCVVGYQHGYVNSVSAVWCERLP